MHIYMHNLIIDSENIMLKEGGYIPHINFSMKKVIYAGGLR